MTDTDTPLGILLPDDGPPDYEWHVLEDIADVLGGPLPGVAVGRVPSDGHHDPAALLSLGAVERLAPVGRTLVDRARPRALIWACTSGSFIGGLAWARQQARGLGSRLGTPVASTALAFLDALSALGHDRVDLLSPYPGPVTERLLAFLSDGGVACRHVETLDCPYAADSHELDIVGEVGAFCRRRPDDATPVVVPDTAVNTLTLTAALGTAAGRAVLTANQVSLWSGLRLTGWPVRSPCLGVLAED